MYLLRFLSTNEICFRGGIYNNMTDILKGREAKNLQQICWIDWIEVEHEGITQ